MWYHLHAQLPESTQAVDTVVIYIAYFVFIEISFLHWKPCLISTVMNEAGILWRKQFMTMQLSMIYYVHTREFYYVWTGKFNSDIA